MSHEASGGSASKLQAIVDDALRFDLRSAFDFLLPVAGMPEGAGDEGGEGGSGDGNEGSGEGAGGDGSESSGDGDGSGDNADDIKNPKLKELSDENAKHRNDKKALQKQLDEVNAKLKEHEDKGKEEVDLLKDKVTTLESENSELKGQVKTQATKLAFFESGAAAQFRNPASALKLLDLSDVEVDDEGKVDPKVMKDKAEALLKTDSYLAKADGDGSDGEDDGSPSGRQTNGQRRSKDELNAEKLKEKFPALRR